jgi:hypothetical protein
MPHCTATNPVAPPFVGREPVVKQTHFAIVKASQQLGRAHELSG